MSDERARRIAEGMRDEVADVTRIALDHHGVSDGPDAHETIARAGAVAYVVALRLLTEPPPPVKEPSR